MAIHRRLVNVKLVRLLIIIQFFGIICSQSFAVEFLSYFGLMNHNNVGGCCQNDQQRNGGGILTRLELSEWGVYDFSIYSNGFWSEGLVMKPYYLVGSPNRFDTGAGEQIKVKTVSDWKWIASFGGGYFIHSSRTKNYDLPILLNGIVLTNFNQFVYSFNQHLYGLGILQFSYAISRNNQSLLFGNFLGIGYDFD